MGSGRKGFPASWHRMKLAAAMPNMAGMGPSTGIVRTLKFGMICRHSWLDAKLSDGHRKLLDYCCLGADCAQVLSCFAHTAMASHVAGKYPPLC